MPRDGMQVANFATSREEALVTRMRSARSSGYMPMWSDTGSDSKGATRHGDAGGSPPSPREETRTEDKKERVQNAKSKGKRPKQSDDATEGGTDQEEFSSLLIPVVIGVLLIALLVALVLRRNGAQE